MNEVESRRLLSVCYFFPPSRVAAAIRMYHLHREFNVSFHSVHVISSVNRHRIVPDPDLTLDEIPVFDIPAIDLRSAWTRMGAGRPVLPHRMKERQLMKWIFRLLEIFPMNVILGEGGLLYIWRAYRLGAKCIREQHVTHLFSTCRPFADAIVCWLLKARSPRLRWIADIQDPVVDPMRWNVFSSTWQTFWFRWTLRSADLVTTVSEGLKKEYRSWGLPVEAIRNWMPGRDHDEEGHDYPDSKVFRIVYTGKIYPKHHDPNLLFRILHDMIPEWTSMGHSLELHYAGYDGEIWTMWMRQFDLLPYSIMHGPLSLKRARQWQRNSSCNLMFTWNLSGKIDGILTSKLFDYMESGRPIIALINGTMDDELDALIRMGKGIVIASEDPMAAQRLAEWLKEMAQGPVPDFDLDSARRLRQEVEIVISRLHSPERPC